VTGATIPDGELLRVEQAARRHPVNDLLGIKYRAPRRRGKIVRRTELLSRLADATEFPLVLITAPGGYGKTILLAQWSEQDERPFVWVTLDDADRDPAVVAESILTALRPTGVVGAGFVLVIDDAHVGDPETLRETVTEVLGWLPAESQIVMAARRAPLRSLARMRAEQVVLELGAEELSMSSLEAAKLLANAGLNLEFTTVLDLTRRTEGWPVALALAAGAVAPETDAREALMVMAGDDHRIAEYVRAEFLDEIPPATQEFLTRSSVLDRMSGPLCDNVLQRTGSGIELARLALTNLPLRAMDPSHEWYCFPELFREMLRTELRRSEPELFRALHRRAGEWHRQVGDFERAIEHARCAGDLDRCGELLWANLPEYLGEGRNSRVQRWLDGASAEQAERSAAFAVTAAHSHLAMGNVALAEQWARSASVALSGTATTGVNPHRAGAVIIEAWAARSGVRRMREDAAYAYELLSEDSPWRASCCFLEGTAALLAGDHAEAGRRLEEGVVRGAFVAPDMASLCLAQLAALSLEGDDLEAADDLARRALDLISTHDLSSYPALALVSAVTTATNVRRRHIDEAKVAAAQCASLINRLGDFAPWYGAEVRILLARGSLALGDVAGAREQLAEASQLARRTPGATLFQRWFDDAWGEFDKRAENALVGVGSLTTAELRVLRFLPTHFSFHEIAERLHVSSNTVKTHVHAVYRKLDASCRSEAVANATRAGLLGS
jgi:LuxR family maltose regulon positive regulatory protein